MEITRLFAGRSVAALRRTAIGRARGTHRSWLIATCLALLVAALGDAATGYDGPGPQTDLALAAVVALASWWLAPVLAALASGWFILGGLASTSFAARLSDPHAVLDFVAGWVQMVGFAACALAALAAVVAARRNRSRTPESVPITTAADRSARPSGRETFTPEQDHSS